MQENDGVQTQGLHYGSHQRAQMMCRSFTAWVDVVSLVVRPSIRAEMEDVRSE